ncbi:MAG: hypothetical protein EI684_22260 [Candidatus Viridilinea halotolerans]|uniref:Uncharacterized protein n=1 Tax=Candidatus Viridilinea halotolerans TaxID=2491704 RepID=A0A426TQX8_9CHLR|nr:MAG: hypothetical protein EI684_22260 [Candidatus Viridilinea halotolerans]
MTTATQDKKQFEQAQAFIEERILTQWQQWRTWLTLHRERHALNEELQSLQEGADGGFDAEERPQAIRLRAIEAHLVAAMSSELRAEFADIFEARRAFFVEKHRRDHGNVPRDAASFDREAYDSLLDMCQGDPATSRPGRVPFQGKWYSLDTAALNRTPKAASFAVSRKRGGVDRAYFIQVGGAGILLVVILAFFFWPEQRPVTALPTTPAAVAVNDAPAAIWMPMQLTLPSATGAMTTFTVQAVDAAGWPPSAPASQTAGWRSAVAWPLELCVPRAVMPPAGTQVQILSAHGAPERTYHLRAAHDTTGRTPPSLRLRACDGDVMLVGTLTQTLPAPHATLGEAQALPGIPTLAVVEIVARGPAVDAAIPAGRVQVEVVVQREPDASVVLDWNTVRPELLVATGQVAGMSAPPQPEGAERVRLRFLIPTLDAPVEALWRISDLTTGAVRDWRLTIPVPLTRDAYLSERLRVEPPQATLHDDGRLDLTLLLATTGGAPLALRYEDIRVTHGEVPLPLPAMTQTDLTVPADESLTVAFTVIPMIDTDEDLIVAIGHRRFAVTWAATGGGAP